MVELCFGIYETGDEVLPNDLWQRLLPNDLDLVTLLFSVYIYG